MVPNPAHCTLGMEYFCFDSDDLWRMTDEDLAQLARAEVAKLKLARPEEVLDVCVARARRAYPIYYLDYAEKLDKIREWLSGLGNLQTCGRYGMYRYNNMDHSMVTGLLAVRNFMGGHWNLWEVNSDAEYHEESRVSEQPHT